MPVVLSTLASTRKNKWAHLYPDSSNLTIKCFRMVFQKWEANKKTNWTTSRKNNCGAKSKQPDKSPFSTRNQFCHAIANRCTAFTLGVIGVSFMPTILLVFRLDQVENGLAETQVNVSNLFKFLPWGFVLYVGMKQLQKSMLLFFSWSRRCVPQLGAPSGAAKSCHPQNRVPYRKNFSTLIWSFASVDDFPPKNHRKWSRS